MSRAPDAGRPDFLAFDPLICGLGALPIPSAATNGGALGPIDGAAAWARLVAILEGRDAASVPEGLVLIETVRAVAPELSDQLALMGAELERVAGPTAATCARFGEAIESPLPSIAMEARVGRMRCLLETDDRHAEDELSALTRRYPELPHQVSLDLMRAQMIERRGTLREAVAAYQAIDLEHPGAPEAVTAREHLVALEAEGQRIPPRSSLEELARAERLVRSGPPALARADIDRLSAMRLPTSVAAEVRLLAARLARVEGRFDAARDLIRQARGLAPSVGDDPEAVAAAALDLEAASRRSEEEARSELRSMGFGRGMRGASATRLYLMSRVAARAQLHEELGALLDEMLRRNAAGPEVSCVVREDTAIIAAGSDDARVARLLSGCEASLTARYHRARALERSGAREEAIAAFRGVLRNDDTDTGFYTLWSETRLAALGAGPGDGETGAVATPEVSAPTEPSAFHLEGHLSPDSHALSLGPIELTPMRLAGPWSLAAIELGEAKLGELRRGPTLSVPPLREAITDTGEVATPRADEPELLDEAGPVVGQVLTEAQVLEVLATLASEHDAGFPWFARARARILLGDEVTAAQELFQVWAAWREATGGTPIRAGTEAVYRGAAPGRIPTDLVTRRDRRRLSPTERESLADVASFLGDHGLATRFGGPARAASRPRPYPELVRAAAARHGLDPNLIWAVMRVESVYNPSIVSYAGAIGLLQIMPRTGRLIAHALGRTDFTTADLLDPATNIEFGAWYLRSLLDRFEGRIPLAIASYNGGPHNVRRWMADHSPDLPVDALCERIPFDQTFRYVRRVLHHYRAYRASEGLGLPELEPTLPGAAVDTVAF